LNTTNHFLKSLVGIPIGDTGGSYFVSLVYLGSVILILDSVVFQKQNICLSEIPDEIVLLNRTKERAIGEALDLQDAVTFSSKWIHVYSGDVEDAADSDLVIMTLSDKPKEPLLDRNDMAALNLPIMRQWIPPLAKACPEAVFVIAHVGECCLV